MKDKYNLWTTTAGYVNTVLAVFAFRSFFKWNQQNWTSGKRSSYDLREGPHERVVELQDERLWHRAVDAMSQVVSQRLCECGRDGGDKSVCYWTG